MNEQSIKLQLLLTVLFSGIFFMAIPGYSDSADLTVFRLKPAKETVLFISGVSIQQIGNHYFSKLTGPNLNTLNKNGIPRQSNVLPVNIIQNHSVISAITPKMQHRG